MFSGDRVKVGAGTLYAAPLGSTEPTSVTGAWPSGWVALGYTDAGSQFNLNPNSAAVEVEEEYWAVRNVIVGYTGTLDFAMAEQTRQNLALALNAGIGSSIVSATQGANGDGSLWQEMPDIGDEVRVMLGWDSIPKAGTSSTDVFGRLIVRQAYQTGNIQIARRKGNNKALYSVSFAIEKPASSMPFRFIVPAVLSS